MGGLAYANQFDAQTMTTRILDKALTACFYVVWVVLIIRARVRRWR